MTRTIVGHIRRGRAPVVSQNRARVQARVQARRRPTDGGGPVAGLVLAGGRGRRMGGADKGLVRHAGVPLAGYAAAVLAPWCDEVVVSANRNLTRYQALADWVVADDHPGFAGPLAGIAAALAARPAPRWLVCPCDLTDLPGAVPGELLRALRLRPGIDVAVAHDTERLQPLVLAVRRHVLRGIRQYLAAGGRSVHGWLEQIPVARVELSVALGNRNVTDRSWSGD